MDQSTLKIMNYVLKNGITFTKKMDGIWYLGIVGPLFLYTGAFNPVFGQAITSLTKFT
jgi:hypothetical protein